MNIIKEPASYTMKDIARELGISIATVSRALSDSPMISKKTRERVQKFAEEKNFRPNILASQLRMANPPHVKTLGVIVPEIVHYYFASVFAGIEEEATRRGYICVVARSNEEYEKEVSLCKRFFDTRACGIIVSQTKNTTEYAHFQRFINAQIPLVFYDRICTGVDASRVVVDDYKGAFNATTSLINSGCKKIAFYGSQPNLQINQNRYNGYADALQQANINVDQALVFDCDSPERAEQITEKVINEQHPDAFFCINDLTAIAAINVIKRMGLRIPEDISIIGFTDSNAAKLADLTVVDQRGMEVGRNAADILISQVEGDLPVDKPTKRIVKTQLITRGTTKI